MNDRKATIGFIGAGIMGRPMALNLLKGGYALNVYNRTPEKARMPLLWQPKEPTVFELQDRGRSFPPNYLHESWRDYLYWDAELEQE